MAVKLLLPFNNSFHDGSGNDHDVQTPGYFTFLDDSPFGYGLYANTGRIWLDDHSDWQLGTGDFTFDSQVKVDSAGSTYQYVFYLGSGRSLVVLFNKSSRYVRLYLNNSYLNSASSVFSLDTWFHVAVIRSSGVVRVFIDGGQVIEWTNSADIVPVDGLAVANSLSGSDSVAGTAELRFCNHAETDWWGGFTPPTEPYPATDPPVIPPDSSGEFIAPFDDHYFAFNRAGDPVTPRFNGHYAFEPGFLDSAIRFNYGNLYYENHDGLKLNTDDFTVDFRIKIDDYSTGTFALIDSSGSNYLRMFFYSDGRIRSYVGNTNFYAYTAVTTGQWHHVALVRNGDLFILYVDGAMKATYWTSGLTVNPDGNLYIGTYANSESAHLVGLLKKFRVRKEARWITDFDASQVQVITPSATKPAPTTDADFLLHLNNSFADISGTKPGLNGSFNFETGIFEKAIRFNYGNIGFASLDSIKLGGNDFTLDFRMKVDSFDNGNFAVFDTAGSNYLRMYFYTTGSIRLYIGASNWTTQTGLIQIGQWYHIALVRVNRVFLLYLDGVMVWQVVSTPSDLNPIGDLTLGSFKNSESAHLDGLLEEFRVVKDIAGWIEDFTPPASAYPYTTPPDTDPAPVPDFVCHFDDGVFDSSGNNYSVTENAPLTLAYTPGKFDQAGQFTGQEYLIVGQPSDWQIGTGDFLLDCWVKLPVNYTNSRYLFDLGGRKLAAYTYSVNQLRIYINGSSYYLANIPTDRWFHLALLRSGRSFLVYLDGQLGISITYTSSIDPIYDFAIGSYYLGSSQFIGELDELRLFKQSAAFFTGEFTPPTSPQSDPPITAPPINAPRTLGPEGDAYDQTQVFEWTKVFQTDRYEWELIGVETVSDYPNRSYTTTIAYGSYQWRVRAGNTYGYGPWSDNVPLTIQPLILGNPLSGETHNWPEYLYVAEEMDAEPIRLKYAATGVGDNDEEGWENADASTRLYWRSTSSTWIFDNSYSTLYESDGVWSLNGPTSADGLKIERFQSGAHFYYFSPSSVIAAQPPVTLDGFCPIRAFNWDFEQADGLSVSGLTGTTPPANQIDHWKLKLRAGQQYDFTCTLNTEAYRMYFRLYERNGRTQLASGYTNYATPATFSYTPTVSGDYFFLADGYSYGYYGSYTIESDPAPSRGTFSRALHAFSVRQGCQTERLNSHKALRYILQSIRPDAWPAHKLSEIIRRDAISARSETVSENLIAHAARHRRNSWFIEAFAARRTADAARLNRNNAYIRAGWDVYARNTETDEAIYLGLVPADASPRELADVYIPDGTWEIEARPADLFWQDCRTRKVLTLSVGDTSQAGLPAIQNLRREISPTSFQPILKWNIADEYTPQTFDFAVWLTDTDPGTIIPAAPPDYTVRYQQGRGEYQLSYTQSADRYATVAAVSDTENGQPATIFIPWATQPPISPPNQLAIHSQEG